MSRQACNGNRNIDQSGFWLFIKNNRTKDAFGSVSAFEVQTGIFFPVNAADEHN